MQGPDAAEPERALSRRALFDAVLVAGGWLLVAGDVTLQELGAAVLTGVASAAVATTVRRRIGYVGRRPTGWARAIGRAYLGALADTWTLTVALVAELRGRGAPGEVRAVPVRVGADAPTDVSRRALATLTCSLQPNSYLIGFDADRDVALVHERVPSDTPPIDDRLRGRP